MKRTIKVMAAIMLVAAMVCGIAACGALDINKVKGDWIISTVNGKPIADFAAENGVGVFNVQKTYQITDKTMTMSALGNDGTVASETSDITVKADGVEATFSGALLGFAYKDADKTLSYSVTDGTNTYSYVLVKGTYDIAGEYAAAVAAAQGGEEAADEGGEEAADEGGEEAADEGSDEGYEEE